MKFNLDRKLAFWAIILSPTLIVLCGYFISESAIFIYVAGSVFAAMLIYTLTRTIHRCPSCHGRIISWASKCGSCEEFLEMHKDKLPLKVR